MIGRDGFTLVVSDNARIGEFDPAAQESMDSFSAQIKEQAIIVSLECCLLADKRDVIGCVKLVGYDGEDGAAIRTVCAMAKLLLENEELRRKSMSVERPVNGPLSVLVGVHPFDGEQLIKDLSKCGFDLGVTHDTFHPAF